MNEQQAHNLADITLATHRQEIRQHITDSEIKLRAELMHEVIKSRYRD